MATIDGDRLLASLHELRSFGATGTGVVRPTFSDTDMAARQWLRGQMAEAGLDAVVDGVGNVVGTSPNPGPALVIGSHSDTQPEGGWLDGALGVMYAIEIARALGEDPSTTDLAVDTVAWADEEGTYTSCLGSRSWVGDLDDGQLAHRNADGETVADALARVGLTHTPRSRFDPGRHVGYLEAHIEQGPHLEEDDLLIGVVTAIVGIRSRTVEFLGEQNHAGTTPMNRRRDAGVALFDFAAEAGRRIADVAGPASVWTFGRATVHPGAESIVPGRAQLVVQFRDPDDGTLDAIDATLHALAQERSATGPVAISVDRSRDDISPTVMHERVRTAIAAAAEAHHPARWREMPSAAGHDAMVMTAHLPCGMLFIPSIGGVSHDFAENSHAEHIVAGCQVLADAAAAILRDRAVRTGNG